MSENNNSILPDVITPVSDAIQQNLPDTAKQTDGVISTVVGFFNNVILYPVKKANLTFRYKLEAFEDDLKEKVRDIPPENLQVPPTCIAGPVLEALRYSYDEKELRDMYEQMLASAMDNRKANQVHRSYIDAVKQMEPLDAMVLKRIYKMISVTSAHIQFNQKGTSSYYVNALPYHFCPDLPDLGDPFQISASISNLLRLGLLISNIGVLSNDEIENCKKEQYVQSRARIFELNKREIDILVSQECQIISLDSYGRRFVEVCMKGEDEQNAN